jgi:hypothetical protein
MNSACNCCSNDAGPYKFELWVGTRRKQVRAKFCPIGSSSYTALRFYRGEAAPELVPSDPANPAEGELYTDLSVSYSFNNTETLEPEEGICFDLVSGSDTVDRSINLNEAVNEDLKIKVTDLLRDSPQDQLCSTECGSSANPILSGSGSWSSTSERSYSTSYAGGCGANLGDYCGPCPEIDGDPQYECFGDGTQDITVDESTTEESNFSVNGCADNSGPFGSAAWPSTSGTFTTTINNEANCCFAFTCGGFGNFSPDPNPYESTVTDDYDIIDLPPIDEHLTATAINPIDIADVIAAAEEHFASVEYFSSLEDGSAEWSSGLDVSAAHTRYSSPFSESGFDNSAEVSLEGTEYQLALSAPPITCYVKLWLAEEFLPQDYDNDNRDPITGELIREQLRTFTVEHRFPKGDLANTCYKPPDQVGGFGPEGFDPQFLSIITEDSLVLDPPAQAGTVRVRLVKYSLIEGYEPNDPQPDPTESFYTQGCKPNGFPDPTTPCTP